MILSTYLFATSSRCHLSVVDSLWMLVNSWARDRAISYHSRIIRKCTGRVGIVSGPRRKREEVLRERERKEDRQKAGERIVRLRIKWNTAVLSSYREKNAGDVGVVLIIVIINMIFFMAIESVPYTSIKHKNHTQFVFVGSPISH